MIRRWACGEWIARTTAPQVRAVAPLYSRPGEWGVFVNGQLCAWAAAPTDRAARRAAERWVVNFARELLIAAGEESP